MIGNVSGIICDGAKNGCALKVATVTEAAYNSMCLALKNKCVSSIEGIIDEDIEKSKVAGMNAHLAKPIDPDRLYQTLYKFIFEKEEDVTVNAAELLR